MARDGKIQFDFRVQYDDPKAPEVITVKGDPVVHVVKKVQTVYGASKPVTRHLSRFFSGYWYFLLS